MELEYAYRLVMLTSSCTNLYFAFSRTRLMGSKENNHLLLLPHHKRIAVLGVDMNVTCTYVKCSFCVLVNRKWMYSHHKNRP